MSGDDHDDYQLLFEDYCLRTALHRHYLRTTIVFSYVI